MTPQRRRSSRVAIKLAAKRVVAYAIDIALLFGVLGGLQGLLSAVTGFPSWSGLGESALRLEGWVLLSISLPTWLYFLLNDRYRCGATLGKRVMGLRVVAVDGSQLDWGHSLIRTAVKLAPWELTHLALFLPEPFMVTDEPSAWQWVGLLLADAAIVLYLGVLGATSGRRSVHDFAAASEVRETPRLLGRPAVGSSRSGDGRSCTRAEAEGSVGEACASKTEECG